MKTKTKTKREIRRFWDKIPRGTKLVRDDNEKVTFEYFDDDGRVHAWMDDDGAAQPFSPHRVTKILDPVKDQQWSALRNGKSEQISRRKKSKPSDTSGQPSRPAQSKTAYLPGLWYPYHWQTFRSVLNWDEATFWAYLHHWFEYFNDTGALDGRFRTRKGKKPEPLKPHWFYRTRKQIEADLGMSRKVQERLIKSLSKKKLLTKRCMSVNGDRPKRYYRLRIKRLIRMADKKGHSQPRTK